MYFILKAKFFIFLVLGAHLSSAGWGQTHLSPRRLEGRDISVIAFGSCNLQTLPQKLWLVILRQRPDLWIWMGDNIYGDTYDTAELRAKYKKLLSWPEYQTFIGQVPVAATWDDHDFGVNDADSTYPQRLHSQNIFCDFFNEPQDSPRRRRKGIYESYDLGRPPHTVRLILLDTRYNKGKPGSNASMLGEEQWRWFEDQLMGSQAALNIVVSSIQVFADRPIAERWGEFPRDVARLDSLLAAFGKTNVLFLSGDIHGAEIARKTLHPSQLTFHEITSSGMTHSTLLLNLVDNSRAYDPPYCHRNFGLLKIKWGPPHRVQAQILNRKGRVVRERFIDF